MPPTIETERLILRAPVQADFDAGWAEFHTDPDCMRYLGGAMARSVAWRSLATVAGMWSLLGFGQFSAIEKATGRWVGRVGPWRPEGWPASEVGWLFHRAAWGKGYATEAGAACLEYVFGTLGWDFVGHMIPSGQSAVTGRRATAGLAHGRDGHPAAAHGRGGPDPDVGADGGGLARRPCFALGEPS